MAQVATVLTRFTAGNVLAALLDNGAPAAGAKILLAQSALETQSWEKMHNFNVGNITRAGSDNRDYFVLGSGNALHFRAYSSLEDGASDYVNYLGKIGALGYAAQGDFDGYVGQLEKTGYAGRDADYTAYGNTMRSLLAGYTNLQPVRAGIGFGPWLMVGALGLLAMGVMKK